MGQVTIYLDDETEKKLNAILKDAKVSKSNWIAGLIREKAETSWPENVIQLAGAWKDLPTKDELRKTHSKDIEREPL